MRQIIELKSKIKDHNFFLNQFKQEGSKQILFVNPMLSGKQLYKSLLPYFKLPELTDVKTAITGLSEFDMKEQLLGYRSIDIINNPYSAIMIEWATHIVFPFTLQSLISQDKNKKLTGIYAHVRTVNPNCKISYNIDFNFYELPDSHPLKNTFDPDFVIPIVEDNMYFADTVLVTNGLLQQYLINKLSQLVETTHIGVNRGSQYDEIKVNLLPTLMDESIMLDNVEYNPDQLFFKVPVPIPVVEKEPEKVLQTQKNKTTLAAQKVKTPTAKVLKKTTKKKKGKK